MLFDVAGDASAPTAPVLAPTRGSANALAWVDGDAFASGRSASAGWLSSDADLLAERPRRRGIRPSVVAPIALVALLLIAYVAGAALWPLNAIQPDLSTQTVAGAAAPAATPAWPAKGSAAVTVDHVGAPLASSNKASTMASITKLVTALMVLEQQPLKVGQAGPKFDITYRDGSRYREMQYAGESVLDVPVGETLSEYQLLQGMLIGSAGNYAEKLREQYWTSDSDFADQARIWLDQHGLTGISVVGPTGISKQNTADPASLLTLGRIAMANPVIAQIVATKAVKIPGAGTVKNTNKLLAVPGVVGLKTGTLDTYDLLAAKDVTIGATKVRLYAAVLGQKDDKSRVAATDALFNDLQTELALFPSVKKDTQVGLVTTRWGEKVPVITTADAAVVLWNGGKGKVTTDVALKDAAEKGDRVGTLTVAGPVDTAKSDVVLAKDLEGPTLWWRLTHPLELLGAQ